MRLTLVLSLIAAGCASAEDLRVSRELLDLEQPREPVQPAGFAGWVRDNPRVREAHARAEAALARAGGAASLDDPMLFLKAEGVPIRTPGAVNRDEFNAIGLSQSFPLFKLGPRREMAGADARKAVEEYRQVIQEVAAEIRKARAELFIALREKELHDSHREILNSFVGAAEAKYAAGKVSLQDVLEGRSESTMLHVSLADSDARIDAARATLRELTGTEAAPAPPAALPLAASLEELEKLADARPEVRAAEQALRRAEAARTLASRERWIPDLTAEVMVMQMPGEPDAWGGTVGFTLPWFSPKRRAEAAAAEREAEAEERALEAVRRRARREVASAYARVRSALRSHELFDKDLVPRARQNLEVARSNYEKDKIDFLRFLQAAQELRTLEMESAKALAGVETAWAELEWAAGKNLGGAK